MGKITDYTTLDSYQLTGDEYLLLETGEGTRNTTLKAVIENVASNLPDRTPEQAPSGGGGGSTVTVTPLLNSGTKIAEIDVDGIKKNIFAPASNSGQSGSGTIVYYEDVNAITSELKAINPKLNYKGHLNHSTLPELMNPVENDCYIYDGGILYETVDNGIARKGDFIYCDGGYARWKVIKRDQTQAKPHHYYDIVIVGGGAGGIGAAYALKDSGYSVCIVEQLDSLGGTHVNAGVLQQLPSPAPDFYKEIIRDAAATSAPSYFVWDRSTYSVGYNNDTEFDKLWRGAEINYGADSSLWGNFYKVNPFWLSDRYESDLKGRIDILYHRQMKSVEADNGVVKSIKVTNLVNGAEEVIHGFYFIDCTANGDLCRYGKTIDTDFFFGSDGSKYGESASTGSADKTDINTLGCTYMTRNINGNPVNFTDDVPDFKPDLSVGSAINNSWGVPLNPESANRKDQITWQNNPDNPSVAKGYYYTGMTVVDPDYHAGITASDLYKGYDFAREKAENNGKAHFKKRNYVIDRNLYLGLMPLLAIRESYRINCERMLKQQDVETLATQANIQSNHGIVLSSWYCDVHNPKTVNKSNCTFQKVFAIPYECTIPKGYKNVLIGSRCFGASHIALACSRLTKTMIYLGYSVGKAIALARASWLDDVRNVSITQLQNDCGIINHYADIKKFFLDGYVDDTPVNPPTEPDNPPTEPDTSEKVRKDSVMLGGASNNAITFDSGTKVTTVSPNNALDTYSWYNYVFKISNVVKGDVIHVDFSGLSNAYIFAIPYIVNSSDVLISALSKNYITDNGSSLLSGNLDSTLTWNDDDPKRAYQLSGNAYFTAQASGDMYVLIGRTPAASSGTKITIKNITDYVSVYAN